MSDMPPLVQQALSAARAAARHAASGLAVVDDQEQARRLAVCTACEHYDAAQARCRRCGCYARLKSRIATQDCPEGRW